jgi:CelD/BcsL family acetyltransferase involved in cellulose biosynthesis
MSIMDLVQSVSPVQSPSCFEMAVSPQTYNSSPACDLECEVVTDFRRLEELSNDWHRLCQNSRSEIFQEFAWANAFWKTARPSLSLCSLVVHHGAGVAGILPLMTDGKRIGFLAPGDYNDLLCEEWNASGVLAAVLQTLLKMPGGAAECVLQNISARSRIASYLPFLPKGLQAKLTLAFAYPCPAIVAGNDPGIFDRAARKESLRRHENKLRREGRVTFRHIESRREIHQHLPRFFEQQIVRRALLGQRSHFLEPRERAFYAALVDELDPRTQLRFSVLEMEGRPVAYHFGFQCRGKFIWFQSGFDVDLWRCAPGEVLIKRLLEYAHQSGLREFDFTVGGELYKHRFANVIRNNFDLYVERQSSALAAYTRRAKIRTTRVGRQIREKLKTHPLLYTTLKKTFLGTFELVSRQRSLFRRIGPVQYSILAFRELVRHALFEKQELLVFSAAEQSPPPARRGHLKVQAANLSELALLTLGCPDQLRWADLHSWRKRLADGDRMYALRLDGQLVSLLWVTRWPGCLADCTNLPELRVNPPALVETCWSAPAFRKQALAPEAFQLVSQELRGSEDARMYYVTPQTDVRQAMEAVGFKLCSRVVRVRVLHVLRRGWFLP